MSGRTYYLPWPPQANNRLMARRGKGMMLSPKVRDWYENAAYELRRQNPELIEGPVELHIRLSAPFKRKYDIDNRAKCTIDALVKNGIIEEDDCTIVRKITMEADETACVGAHVTISSVAPLSPEKGGV